MSEPNGPRAFPERAVDGYDLAGMSLRDWFAGMALQGLIACPTEDLGVEDIYPGEIAERAWEYADEMLKKRDA